MKKNEINPIYTSMMATDYNLNFGNDTDVFQMHPGQMAEDLYSLCLLTANSKTKFRRFREDSHVSNVITYLANKLNHSVNRLGVTGNTRRLLSYLTGFGERSNYGAKHTNETGYTLFLFKRGNTIRLGIKISKFFEPKQQTIYLPLKGLLCIQKRNVHFAEYLIIVVGIINELAGIKDILDDELFNFNYKSSLEYPYYKIEYVKDLLRKGHKIGTSKGHEHFILNPPPFKYDVLNRLYLKFINLYRVVTDNNYHTSNYSSPFIKEEINELLYPERSLVHRFKWVWAGEDYMPSYLNLKVTEPFTTELLIEPINMRFNRDTIDTLFSNDSLPYEITIRFNSIFELMYSKSMHYLLLQNRNYAEKEY